MTWDIMPWYDIMLGLQLTEHPDSKKYCNNSTIRHVSDNVDTHHITCTNLLYQQKGVWSRLGTCTRDNKLNSSERY